MAGHSKWANIKNRKEAQDVKKAKLFAKLAKEIAVAAAKGNDPNLNSALKMVIAKAKALSMPKKNIENIILKTQSHNQKTNFKEILYGANLGAAVFIIRCLTNNLNRTSSWVQHIVSKYHGSLTSASAVSYIFKQKGVLKINAQGKEEESVMLLALEAGAENFETSENFFTIFTDPPNFFQVKDKLEKAMIKEFIVAEVRYVAKQQVNLEDDKLGSITSFLEALKDNEDIQDVYHNLVSLDKN